jgi:hypothetical protein
VPQPVAASPYYFEAKLMYSPSDYFVSGRIVDGLSAFSAIMLVLVSVVFAMVWWFRSNRVIFAASPPFLYVSLSGLLLAVVTSFVLIDPGSVGGCRYQIWGINIAFTLTFTPCILKMYRLHKIFNNPLIMISKVSNWKLVLVLAFFLLLDVIILTSISLLSTVQFGMYRDSSGVGPEYYACDTRQSPVEKSATVALQGILAVSKALVLLMNSYYAYQTRNVPGMFNEGKQISIAVFITAVIALLMLWLMLSGAPPAQQRILLHNCVLVCVLSVLVSFFFPKLHILWVHAKASTNKKSTATSGLSTVDAENVVLDEGMLVPQGLSKVLEESVAKIRRKRNLHTLETRLLDHVTNLRKNDASRKRLDDTARKLCHEALIELTGIQKCNHELHFLRKVRGLDVEVLDDLALSRQGRRSVMLETLDRIKSTQGVSQQAVEMSNVSGTTGDVDSPKS